MRIISYTDTIEIEDGRIIRTVYADYNSPTYKKKGRIPVYIINDEGKENVNGWLQFNCYGGYFLDSRTGDFEREWDEPWLKMNSFKKGKTTKLTKEDIRKILLVYPDFKWTLDKDNTVYKADAMNLLIAWKKEPRIEMMVATKMKRLALNKSFLKMGKEKQKAILNFVKQNPEAAEWPLNKIFFTMKRKNAKEYDQWQDFTDYKGKKVKYKWWKKYGANEKMHMLYLDYIWMAKQCGHDVSEEYWEYPKDIVKAHDKVNQEYKRKLEAERLAQEKQQRKEDREKKKKFLAAVQKLNECHVNTKKFTAFIPQDIETVKRQADILHQCLISMDYIGDIARKECILVFITDNIGTPAATAEILPSGKIGQFYANQDNMENMDPTEEQKKVLDTWLDKFREKAVKLMKKKAA